MARYLVKFDELNTKNNYERQLLNKIEEAILNIEQVKTNLDWEGPAFDKFISVYDEYVSELKDMLKYLKSCLNVTEKFYSNYNDGYNKIKKDFKNLQDEMVMKWKKK